MGIITESLKAQRKEAGAILAGGLSLLASMTLEGLEALVWVPIVLCGIPIIAGAAVALAKEHDITADLLVSIAIAASVLIGELEAAAEVSVIMGVGSFLEEATVAHANSRIGMAAGLRPDKARIVNGNGTEDVSPDSLMRGDIVRVLPGETIPADGEVVSGTSSVDTSMMTGEPVPKDVAAGDKVYGGTANMYGCLDIEVENAGEGSAASRMERLIREADANRSRVVRTADRWASRIVVMALAGSVLAYLLTLDVERAVTVLVVFCPCALVLATPTAMMAAAANLSGRGVLVKDGGAMERMADVGTVLMDKTGTLTTGRMECLGFFSVSGYGNEEISRFAAAAESLSEHPIGKAIAGSVKTDDAVEDFEYIPGQGIRAKVCGHAVTVGNRALLRRICPGGIEKLEIETERRESEGFLCVLVGIDGESAGYALLSNTLRPSSKWASRHLRMLGLRRIMLTGDSEAPARRMSAELGLDDAVWECMPSDKLRIVSSIEEDGRCCMIGDGVNDAPSLKRAHVGVSIGGGGLASESSDIVMMGEDLAVLPGVFSMARRTLKTIRIGIASSLTLNLAATVLAFTGTIGPVEGALVHNAGSVAVILAAAALLTYDPWKPGRHSKKKRKARTFVPA